MAGEKNFIKKLKKGLKGKVLFQTHSDNFSPGIPDLSYDIKGMAGSGWIEMKRKAEWPVRETTVVRMDHFVIDQRNWISKHGDYNNRCFIFIQIDKDHLLFDHRASHMIGNLNKEDLIKLAKNNWHPTINYKELYGVLKNGSKT